ncbi:MAG: sodium:proton antiporter [Clostridiales Family XIII bacterium]|jgi:CPA1 family monovalent cation:H+ antiporter|nr:sodium:proton antiporter [Clostridiales Family XIII bacterium]
MEITTIVITILFAIVFSNTLGNLLPKLPLTLLQIALGCLLGLTQLGKTLELEPEIFMALVIAPLLFREAEETSLPSLWKMKKPVFGMAFLLVFITVFAVGFSVHLLIPLIPLAACFALGAVLGPTDVVAVSSMSARVKINRNLMSILKGEGLINDASGVISFQFAIAALLTGTFSAGDALGKLIVVCAGGFLIGSLISSGKQGIVAVLKKLSVRSTASYMLIELLMPFLCYMAAELCGVSGILAAVAAGSRQALEFKNTELFEADLAVAKDTMWGMLTFTLNSLVFLLLGLQLPEIAYQIWEDRTYSHAFLVLVIVIVTLVFLAVRFVSVIFLARGAVDGNISDKLKGALILTISGVKGTVSLATAFSLPHLLGGNEAFVQRPLLMFITGGVIILSLALAFILLPLITEPSSKTRVANGWKIAVLKEVAARMRARRDEHWGAVIVNYQKRIRALERAEYEKSKKKELRALREFVRQTEMKALVKNTRNKEFPHRVYRVYREILSIMLELETGALTVKAAFRLSGLKRILVQKFRRRENQDENSDKNQGKRRDENRLSVTPSGEHWQDLQDLFWQQTDIVIKGLDSMRGRYSDELIGELIEGRIDLAGQVMEGLYGDALHARLNQEYENEMLKGYDVERQVISEFLERGRLTEEQANTMRVNVNKLESFTLADKNNDLALKLMSLGASQRKY